MTMGCMRSRTCACFFLLADLSFRLGDHGDVGSGGSIKVSVVDDKGQRIVEAELVSKTVTDGYLNWSQKTVADRIRRKFKISNAKL